MWVILKTLFWLTLLGSGHFWASGNIPQYNLIVDKGVEVIKESFGSGGETTLVDTTGITSLGGLTGATQTFGNDTNVTMTSSGSEHTLGWSGTLARTRGGFGAAVSFGVGAPLLGNGTGAIFGSSSPSFGQLNATTTATSTVYGGFWAENGGGGIRSDNGLVITGGSLNNSSTATSTWGGGIQFTGAGNICTAGGACLGGSGSASLFTDGGDTTYLTATADNVGIASTSVDTRFKLGVNGGAIISGTTTLGTLVATSSTFFLGTSTKYALPSFQTATGSILVNDGKGNWNGSFEGWQLLQECHLAVASTSCGFVDFPQRRFYQIFFNPAGSGVDAISRLILNGDKAGNYSSNTDVALTAETETGAAACNLTGTTNRPLRGGFEIMIPNIATLDKSITLTGTLLPASAATAPTPVEGSCMWDNSTDPITSFSIELTQATTYNAGTAAFLYGSRK